MAFEKIFYCPRCGAWLGRNGRVCSHCGFDGDGPEPYGDRPALGAGGVGWSERIGDSRFAGYQRSRRVYILLFTLGLLVLVPALLFAFGQLSFDGEGLAVAGVLVVMFLLIGLSSLRGARPREEEWEGTVEEKLPWFNREANLVYIRLDDGRRLKLSFADQALLYDYFKVGDRIRAHRKKNLRALEKFDKRGDEILFCPSCGSLSDARADYCAACGSPLLKGKQA